MKRNHRLRFFPFQPRLLELLKNQQPFSLTQEIAAGFSVGLIALPLALALGTASIPAGMDTPLPPPTLGLLTAVAGGAVVSALGGSRVQIAGPTAAFIPIVLLIAGQYGYSGLLLSTIMAGVILVLMSLARMGSLIKFIPWPVTSGFTSGIAVSIILTQIPDFTGMSAAGPLPREFMEKIHWLASHAGQIHFPSLILAISSLAVILVWPRVPLRWVPGSVVAVVGASAVVALASGTQPLAATLGSKFGEMAFVLPAPQFPDLSWQTLRELVGPATAIALLGAIESLLSATVADGLCGDRHDSNTELAAQGLANIGCALLGGLPVTGAIARTSANIQNGARTPLAGLFCAATLLGIAMLGSRWAALIPLPAMAAVLIAVAWRMGEWHELVRLPRMPRSDALVLLTTFGLTVVFDLVIAVEVGMVLAAILFIKRVAETTEVSLVTSQDMLERPEHIAHGKDIPPGVLVFRIFGPFLFGAAEKMEDAMARIERWPHVLILRMHLVTAMDTTGLNALESVVERMQARGGHVILSGIHQQPLLTLRKAGFLEVLGRENIQPTFDDALARARALLLHSSPDNRQQSVG